MNSSDFRNRFTGYEHSIMNARGDYAVLVPLVTINGECSILYEVRSKNIDVQPNEVCFPGGRIEKGETPSQGAVRETFEEIGIQENRISVIAELDTLHPASELLIHPILAEIKDYSPDILELNPDEVGQVFTVPVEFLKEEPYVYKATATRGPGEDFPYERMGITKDYPWRKRREEIVLYEYDGHPIWGMTAMITRWIMEKMRND